MDSKYKDLLTELKEQKNKMKILHHHQSDEKSFEHGSLYWDTVFGSLKVLLGRIKTQQASAPATEQDIVNMRKIAELIHAFLTDFGNINQEERQNGSDLERNPAFFGNQMVRMKHCFDLLTFEMTKLKTVNEDLSRIISNYKAELATATSDPELGEED